MGKAPAYAYDSYSDKNQDRHPDTKTFMDRVFPTPSSRPIDSVPTPNVDEVSKGGSPMAEPQPFSEDPVRSAPHAHERYAKRRKR